MSLLEMCNMIITKMQMNRQQGRYNNESAQQKPLVFASCQKRCGAPAWIVRLKQDLRIHAWDAGYPSPLVHRRILSRRRMKAVLDRELVDDHQA